MTEKPTHPAIRFVHRIEDGAIVVVLLAMILLAVAQIVLRNTFETSVVWIDPLLRIGVVWIGLLGSMIASRNNDHIAIDLVSHYVPDAVKRIILTVVSLFAVGVCSLVAWYSYQFVLAEYQYPTPIVGDLNTWMFQTIIPAAFAIIALRYLILAVLAVMNRVPLDVLEFEPPLEDGEDE